MAVTASEDHNESEILNKNKGDLEYLLSQLGEELGVDSARGEGSLIPHDPEEFDKVIDNEENVFKLLQSLESAGKIMDLIDKKGRLRYGIPQI